MAVCPVRLRIEEICNGFRLSGTQRIVFVNDDLICAKILPRVALKKKRIRENRGVICSQSFGLQEMLTDFALLL